jgi:hypothetical protein
LGDENDWRLSPYSLGDDASCCCFCTGASSATSWSFDGWDLQPLNSAHFLNSRSMGDRQGGLPSCGISLYSGLYLWLEREKATLLTSTLGLESVGH